MGYVPILLSLSGFIFLWGIFNYYALRSLSSEINKSRASLLETKNSLLPLLRSSEKLDIKHVDKSKLDQIIATDSNGQSTKEQLSNAAKLVKLLPKQTSRDRELKEPQATFNTLHYNLYKEHSLYAKKLREYNRAIRKYPTKLLATLTNLKPLD